MPQRIKLLLTLLIIYVSPALAQPVNTPGRVAPVGVKKTQSLTSATYNGRQILVGSGGGFTGLSTTYYLLDNGLLFSKQDRDTTFTALGKQTPARTKRLFTAVEITCHIKTTRFNKPGNRYRFIGWQHGGEAYRVTWGAAGTTVPTAYEITYNAFMNQLPISHPNQSARVAIDPPFPEGY